MKFSRRDLLALGLGVFSFIVLFLVTWNRPFDAALWYPWIFFAILDLLTTIAGIPLGGGVVSLEPMTAMASYLIMGSVPASWSVFVGSLLYGVLRQFYAERLGLQREKTLVGALGVTLANAGIQSMSVLAAGTVFTSLGGETPVQTILSFGQLRLAASAAMYLLVNYLFVFILIGARGGAAVRLYFKSLPRMFLYEATPLAFAPLLAVVYTNLGPPSMMMLSLLFIVVSLIARNLARTGERLARRVRELDSLQAVSAALSASLQLQDVMKAIYQHTATLMPVEFFYVALMDVEEQEFTYPLVIENGTPVYHRPQPVGNSVTEYVFRARKPLLIRERTPDDLARLGIDQPAEPFQSWLGVPILAGDVVLGVMAVLSKREPSVFDPSHQNILAAIASQAGLAIQNARLYAHTDEALARRVQELDSILRTTAEGILLLDPQWQIVAANRSLAGFLGIEVSELAGNATEPGAAGEILITRLGYTLNSFLADCEDIAAGRIHRKQQTISLSGPPALVVERTLGPVRDRDGAVTAWLLVFRDRSEEMERERAKEEMMQTLVHDLRAPLSTMMSSVSMLEEIVGRAADSDVANLLELARRGGERLMRMVNQLLDINKLESGKMNFRMEVTDINLLLEEVVVQLSPLANEAHLEVQFLADENLPLIKLDAEAMSRVFYNLLDNAIKFTPDDGRIILRTTFNPGQTRTVYISIQDTGPGIPAEMQHRLFKKFERIHSTPGRRVGTGLGLSYAKLVVEAHRGDIWVESAEGQGSTFYIRLPLTDEAEE